MKRTVCGRHVPNTVLLPVAEALGEKLGLPADNPLVFARAFEILERVAHPLDQSNRRWKNRGRGLAAAFPDGAQNDAR